MVIVAAGGHRLSMAAFVVDTFARFMKVMALFGSAAGHHHVHQRHEGARSIDRFEYPVLILLATVGMMMMISANDLIALYIGLELQSLALYVVAAIHRDNVRSSEAGLKYFVLGALSSGMLLYGASLIYGFTGTRLRRHRRAVTARRRHRADLRPRLPDRRPRLQGLGGAVPHVDARRL